MPWPQLREEFRRVIKASGKSGRAIAGELEMDSGQLSRILGGKTKEPHRRTRNAMQKWMLQQRLLALQGRVPEAVLDAETAANVDALADALRISRDSSSPEEELLEFFLEHQPEMATFMTLQAEELDEVDRRKVYFAGLNAMKRAYIRVGDPIPQVLFELERRFLGEQ